ncbi:hypothetical protein [Desulfuromonas sp.]|uniref:hypothetical protein n=1 Tax=Desulfuromonas sp. TaxID=892 RepID=UPI0025BB98E6|nr:hypothetical protein [Desulfuromonas sp.]
MLLFVHPHIMGGDPAEQAPQDIIVPLAAGMDLPAADNIPERRTDVLFNQSAGGKKRMD